MATIINKTAPTPLIPLANPGGVSIPSSAMAAIESAMAHPHIGTNKAASKKSKKKANKQQKNAQAAMYKNTASVPVHDVEVVEGEIVEPVKEEIVLPEVKTASVVIAHTEEKEATKAALPDERMMGLYADFEGIKNEILAAHKNGAILPEGFAKVVREVADTIDAVEKVDASRRGISIKKETYSTGYTEPDYSLSECKPTQDVYRMPYASDEYIRIFIPLNDYKYLSGEIGKYPSLAGRSVLQTISDNYEYVSDSEFRTTIKGSPVLLSDSPMALSGFIVYDTDPELSHLSIGVDYNAMFTIDIAVPRDYYYTKIASKMKVYVANRHNSDICNNPFNLSDVSCISAHALSFDDITELFHNHDVLKWGSKLIHFELRDEIDDAWPHGITPDGNLLIYSDRFDRDSVVSA